MKKILARNPRDLLLFVLGINSALRVSDLLKLKVTDLVDDRGHLRANLEIQEGKTGKSKRFEINKSVRSALGKRFRMKDSRGTVTCFGHEKELTDRSPDSRRIGS